MLIVQQKPKAAPVVSILFHTHEPPLLSCVCVGMETPLYVRCALVLQRAQFDHVHWKKGKQRIYIYTHLKALKEVDHGLNTYTSFRTWVQLPLARYSCGPSSYMCDVCNQKRF